MGQLTPPTAVVTSEPSTVLDALDVDFDATGSYDTDGVIVRYDWDFESDGTYDLLDGGATPSFTYPGAGTYTATVRVTDNDDLQDTATSTPYTVPANASPPEAIGTSTPDPSEPTRASFDASESFDDDGTIVQYDWDMDNDGTFEIIDGGPTPSHDFGEYGTFTVGVRVTDDDGLTDDTTIDVTLTNPDPDPNPDLVPPVADLSPDPATGDAPDLAVTWDATGSTDSDGTIEQYDWDMDNDGTYEITDGGPTQAVTYPTGGIYTVGVQVTDNDGLTDAATADVDVNNPPVADLAASIAGGSGSGRTVSFPVGGIEVLWDATASSDSDGTIVTYDWDMDNDGIFELLDSTATQTVTTAAYDTYTVGVRVTDDDGAQDQTTADITLEGTPPTADLTGTAGSAAFGVEWDASGSTDLDGYIAQYEWDVDNDGTYDHTGLVPTYDYDYGSWGEKTCTVRVTDDDGMSDTATASYTLLAPPNADLDGSFMLAADQQSWDITWDATGSSDPDGTIVQYDWDLDNDGIYETAAAGDTQVQNVPDYGVYTVGVLVTDNDGLTDSTTATVSILAPPVAVLATEPTTGTAPIDITWHAESSYDIDGIIVQFDWDMDNDGTYEVIDGLANQAVNYSTGGLYTAWVRVTDNDGLTDETSLTIDINNPPTAVLTNTFEQVAPTNWIIHWDATGSYDNDGTVVQYDWDTNNDGTFNLIDYGPNFDLAYFDTTFSLVPVVGVRVTDDDGAQDVTYESTLFPPIGIVAPDPIMWGYPAPCDVEWDASASFDPDGGDIVTYHWDIDANGSIDIFDGGPIQTIHYDYGTEGMVDLRIVVIDDEGEEGTGVGSHYLAPPA